VISNNERMKKICVLRYVFIFTVTIVTVMSCFHAPAFPDPAGAPPQGGSSVVEPESSQCDETVKINTILEDLLYHHKAARTSKKPAKAAESWSVKPAIPSGAGAAQQPESTINFNWGDTMDIRESKTAKTGDREKSGSRMLGVTVESPAKTWNTGSFPGHSNGETSAAVDCEVSPATTVKLSSAAAPGGNSSNTVSVERKIGESTVLGISGRESDSDGVRIDTLCGTVSRRFGRFLTLALSAEKEKSGEIMADSAGASLSSKVGASTEVELAARTRIVPDEEQKSLALKAVQKLPGEATAALSLESMRSDLGIESSVSELMLEKKVWDRGLIRADYGISKYDTTQSAVASINCEMKLRKSITIFGGLQRNYDDTPSKKAEIGLKAGKEYEQLRITLSGEKEDAMPREMIHRLFFMYIKRF